MKEALPTNEGAKGLDVVIRSLSYTAGVAILLVIVAAQIAPSPMMQGVSSFVLFFGSVFISFVVTKHYAEITAREELKRLAEAAGSRIFLLSVQMRQLVGDLSNFENDDELTKVFLGSVSSQIERLSAQADLSVEDLERIADVDLELPAMRDAAQTRVEASTKREQIACPHCQETVDVTIGTAAGANKHGRCPKCRKGFMVHRIADGSLKISHTNYFRIDCPNPACDNEIGINRRESEWGTIIRNCYECHARVRYDLDKGQVESHVLEPPLDLKASAIVVVNSVRRGPCSGCGYSLILSGHLNRSNEEVLSCPRCTKLVRVTAD